MSDDHDVHGEPTHYHPDFQKLLAERPAQAARTDGDLERAARAARGIEPRSLTSRAEDPTTSCWDKGR